MASSMALTLFALIVPMVFTATVKHHTLTISEKGVLFDQATNVDVKNQIVYIRVPAHRDISESRIMYEFTTGRVLRCNPVVQRCYLSNFDTNSIPDARQEEQELKEFARKRTSPKKEEQLEMSDWQKMVVTEKIQKTHFLSTRMRTMLGNYTLFWEEPLPNGAKILKGKLDLDNTPEMRYMHDRCAQGATAYTKYLYSAKDCNYLALCSNVHNPSTCVLKQHHYTHYYKCKCCPWAWKPKNCIRCEIW